MRVDTALWRKFAHARDRSLASLATGVLARFARITLRVILDCSVRLAFGETNHLPRDYSR